MKKLNTNKFLSFIQATYPNPSMDGHPMRTHNELFERQEKNNNWPLRLAFMSLSSLHSMVSPINLPTWSSACSLLHFANLHHFIWALIIFHLFKITRINFVDNHLSNMYDEFSCRQYHHRRTRDLSPAGMNWEHIVINIHFVELGWMDCCKK